MLYGQAKGGLTLPPTVSLTVRYTYFLRLPSGKPFSFFHFHFIEQVLAIMDTVRRPLKEAFLASKTVILDYFSRELPF